MNRLDAPRGTHHWESRWEVRKRKELSETIFLKDNHQTLRGRRLRSVPTRCGVKTKKVCPHSARGAGFRKGVGGGGSTQKNYFEGGSTSRITFGFKGTLCRDKQGGKKRDFKKSQHRHLRGGFSRKTGATRKKRESRRPRSCTPCTPPRRSPIQGEVVAGKGGGADGKTKKAQLVGEKGRDDRNL